MSSIPHDQTSANTTAHGSRAVAGWLWALLGSAVLAGALLLIWKAGQATRDTLDDAPAMPAISSQADQAPQMLDMDAAPVDGNPLPRYPEDLLADKVEGDVIARLQIDSNGRVTDASIVAHQGQQDRRLDEAALEALLQWRFRPALRDGQAIASVVQVPVEFRSGR